MKKSKSIGRPLAILLTVCILISMTFTVSAEQADPAPRWTAVFVNQVGEDIGIHNGKVVSLYEKPSVVSGTSWAVPLRTTLERFGLTVTWKAADTENNLPERILVDGTSVAWITINDTSYITLAEISDKLPQLTCETRIAGDETYLIIYKEARTDGTGTLTNDEFTAYANKLKGCNYDHFYINYAGQREETYSCEETIGNVQQLAEQYEPFKAWKEGSAFAYSTLLGSFFDNIPIVELSKNDGAANKPLVIVQHGWCGSKYEELSFMSDLADMGYRVIAIDAYGHGERTKRSDVIAITTLQVALRLTLDLDKVLDYYQTTRAEVDTERFAMAGFSMGSVATYNQLAIGRHKPCVAVPLLGTPDWKGIVEESYDDNPTYPAAAIIRSTTPGQPTYHTVQGVLNILRLNNTQGKSLSPMDRLLHDTDWENTAILAVNSLDDPIIPPDGAATLLSGLGGENHQYIVQPLGSGHAITAVAYEASIAFIQTHLPLDRSIVNITMQLDSNTCVAWGNVYTEEGIKPVLTSNGVIVLPIRSSVTNALGYTVGYDAAAGRVNLTDANGVTTEVAAEDVVYINGRSYLPLGKYTDYMNCQGMSLLDNGTVYLVLYQDSYAYATLNARKAAAYIQEYRALTAPEPAQD